MQDAQQQAGFFESAARLAEEKHRTSFEFAVNGYGWCRISSEEAAQEQEGAEALRRLVAVISASSMPGNAGTVGPQVSCCNREVQVEPPVSFDSVRKCEVGTEVSVCFLSRQNRLKRDAGMQGGGVRPNMCVCLPWQSSARCKPLKSECKPWETRRVINSFVRRICLHVRCGTPTILSNSFRQRFSFL